MRRSPLLCIHMDQRGISTMGKNLTPEQQELLDQVMAEGKAMMDEIRALED